MSNDSAVSQGEVRGGPARSPGVHVSARVYEPPDGPIKSHYHAWKRACARAGITDLVLHDYRRTGCRNLTKAGVSPVAAMCITGHRTTAMFERYNIGGTDMAAEAMRKLAAATAGGPA